MGHAGIAITVEVPPLIGGGDHGAVIFDAAGAVRQITMNAQRWGAEYYGEWTYGGGKGLDWSLRGWRGDIPARVEQSMHRGAVKLADRACLILADAARQMRGPKA